MRTVSVSYFKAYYDACQRAGASEKGLLNLIPGGKGAMADLDARLPVQSLFDILEYAEAETSLANIGLLAGMNIRPESFRGSGQVIMFSATLRDAAHVNHKYQPLSQQFGRTELAVVNGLATLRWVPHYTDCETYRRITDAVIASHGQFTRWLSWQHDMGFEAVYFRHKKPSYAAEYEKIFKCPIYFEHEFDGISNAADFVDLPLPQANAELFVRTCKTLDAQLAALETPKSAVLLVSNMLENSLEDGPPSLPEIADKMNMSVRSMRRRLAAEGTNYRAVLDEVRQALCEQYFVTGKLSLSEIASRLGYSEQSAFNRAFQRWHNTAPKTYIDAMKVFNSAFDQMAP